MSIKVSLKDNLSSFLKREIRKAVGARHNCPVIIVNGNEGPKLTGTSSYYATKGGTEIRHPNAYSKVGWSNMVYQPSTRRVEVGAEWLLNNLSLYNLKLLRLKAFL